MYGYFRRHHLSLSAPVSNILPWELFWVDTSCPICLKQVSIRQPPAPEPSTGRASLVCFTRVANLSTGLSLFLSLSPSNRQFFFVWLGRRVTACLSDSFRVLPGLASSWPLTSNSAHEAGLAPVFVCCQWDGQPRISHSLAPCPRWWHSFVCLGGSLAGSVSVWHSPGYRIACVSEGMRERDRQKPCERETE